MDVLAPSAYSSVQISEMRFGDQIRIEQISEPWAVTR